MTCDEIGPELSAFADGELDEAAASRVRAHVAGCAACGRSLALWAAAARRLREEGGPADLSARFRAALPSRAGRSRWRRRWAFPAAAALVLAAMLAVDQVRAARNLDALVELEGANRTETIGQLSALESLQLEIAALGLQARALGRSDFDALEDEVRRLVEEERRLRAQLLSLRDDLERDGLLSPLPETNDEPSPR